MRSKFGASGWFGRNEMASRWKTHTVDEMPWLASFQAEPGCYAVFMDGRLVYIGQTADLRKRMMNHNFRQSYSNQLSTPWGFCKQPWIKVRKPRIYGDWAMVELRLIRRLQPPMNCVGSVKQRMIRGRAYAS